MFLVRGNVENDRKYIIVYNETKNNTEMRSLCCVRNY